MRRRSTVTNGLAWIKIHEVCLLNVYQDYYLLNKISTSITKTDHKNYLIRNN